MEVNLKHDIKSTALKRKRDTREYEEPEWEEEDESEEDEEDKEFKQLPVSRNADMFRQKDPTAGQLFVFVGKSERGKTHFIRWLVQDQMTRPHKPLKFGLVFVKTKFKHSYSFVPDDRVIQGYDEEILRKYVENLEAIYEEEGSLPPNFIIFDDLVGILNNQTQWFINFISTYRHFNISIFIAVQYLTGRHAVSPIMREQTTFAIMFNSKTHRTIQNLWEAFGQLFETVKEFREYLFSNTEPKTVGPYVCLVYKEAEDEVEKNYIPMRAPARVPKLKARASDQNPDQQSALQSE